MSAFTARRHRILVATAAGPARETRRDRRARTRAEAQAVAARQAALGVEVDEATQADEALARLSSDTPAQGMPGPAQLRMPRRLRLATHRASTGRLGATYPFLADRGLGSRGMYIGTDAYANAAFAFDPWQLYREGRLTNPNLVLAGRIGKGKSSLMKSIAVRSAAFGIRSYIPSDIKGEWTPVAQALGGRAIRLGLGQTDRINPLDPGTRPSDVTSDAEWAQEVRQRRLLLISSLAEQLLHRPVHPVEDTCLNVALDRVCDRVTIPLLPHIVHALFVPDVHGALPDGFDTWDQFRADSRELGHALSKLTAGSLGGIFDRESTAQFDPSLPMISIDISELSRAEDLLPLVMACVSTWMESAVRDPAGGQRWMIYDECWRVMQHVALLRRMQAQWKLARAWGLANAMVIHRLSDVAAVGDEGSEARKLALGLVADSGTRITYAQETDQLAGAQEALGLNDTEVYTIGRLAKGVGLWQVDQANGEKAAFTVHHYLPAREMALFDTNQRMVA